MTAPRVDISEVDGGKIRSFSIGKMPARTSFKTRIRLLRMVGEPLFRMLSGGGLRAAASQALAQKGPEDGAPADMAPAGVFDALMSDPDAIGKAIERLAVSLDADQVLDIADTVFEFCRCDGKPFHGSLFDPTFANMPPGAVEKVLFAALKENYRDFFGAAL